MKKILLLLFTAITANSFATIHVVGGGNQNVSCSVGDTIRFTSGCQGPAPSSAYELTIYDSGGGTLYSNFPLPLPFDYVATGNEASWWIQFDDMNACGTGGNISVLAGIDQYNPDQNNSFSIFPNPCSTQITLKSIFSLRNATIQLQNCFGETVTEIKNVSGNSIALDCGNLSAGVYFVRLTEGAKIILTKKLLVID